MGASGSLAADFGTLADKERLNTAARGSSRALHGVSNGWRLLLRPNRGDDFFPFQGPQSLSHRRVPRDKTHALAKTFAFPRRLARIPIGGVNGCAMATQAQFPRRFGHATPALWIPRGPGLLVFRFAFVHGTPPVSPSRELCVVHTTKRYPARSFRRVSTLSA